MRFSSCLLVVALAGTAVSKNGKPAGELKVDQHLVDVKLTPQDGSRVKLTIKNLGKKQLNFFQRGTILGECIKPRLGHTLTSITDDNPVHKLNVATSAGMSG
jgi:hypothetical protein